MGKMSLSMLESEGSRTLSSEVDGQTRRNLILSAGLRAFIPSAAVNHPIGRRRLEAGKIE
jgi:hypothetical protein